MVGYGLVSTLQIRQIAVAVCEVLGGGEEAVLLLCETAAAETLCGTLPDRTRNGAGRGLCQCDEVPFYDTTKRAAQADVIALEKAFDFNLRELKWNEITYSPLLAMVLCRLHYKLRPGAIPRTMEARGEYWKKHYNTVLGRGSVKDYVFKAKAWERFFCAPVGDRV